MTDERTQYFYRFEDRRYSVADEYGDHAYTSHKVILMVFPVIRYTPCGVRVHTGLWESYPKMPKPYDPDANYFVTGERFINFSATKQFACASIRLAAESYRARKSRQISIYQARIRGAESHLQAMEAFLRARCQDLKPAISQEFNGQPVSSS